jgi:predicted transcriptional regulator
MAEEMLTAKKVAEQIGVSPAKVTKYIKEEGVEPDKTKGACKYYGPKTVKVIEKALAGK